MSKVTLTIELGDYTLEDLINLLQTNGFYPDIDVSTLEPLPPITRKDKIYQFDKKVIITKANQDLVPRLIGQNITAMYSYRHSDKHGVWIRVFREYVYIALTTHSFFDLLVYPIENFKAHWLEADPEQGRGIRLHIAHTMLTGQSKNCSGRVAITARQGGVYGYMWKNLSKQEVWDIMQWLPPLR